MSSCTCLPTYKGKGILALMRMIFPYILSTPIGENWLCQMRILHSTVVIFIGKKRGNLLSDTISINQMESC